MKYQILSTKIFFIVLALTILIATAFFFQKYSIEVMHWVEQLGWLAPILFLFIYCLASIMFLPTMVITFAGGAIFGPFWGTVLNLLGATCGAAFSFLITRHLIFDWFSQKKGVKVSKLIDEVDQKGWGVVALLRLFPIIPFNLVNYGLGVTGIKFSTYLITTFVFLIPPEIIYTYFGYAGMDILLTQGSFYRNSGMIISGVAIIILCLFKFGLLKINQFHFKRRQKNINVLAMDESLGNEHHR